MLVSVYAYITVFNFLAKLMHRLHQFELPTYRQSHHIFVGQRSRLYHCVQLFSKAKASPTVNLNNRHDVKVIIYL